MISLNDLYFNDFYKGCANPSVFSGRIIEKISNYHYLIKCLNQPFGKFFIWNMDQLIRCTFYRYEIDMIDHKEKFLKDHL